jgi:signal peptidase I
MSKLSDIPPFSWWRARRARKHAKEVLHHVRRLLGSHRDLMKPEDVAAAEKAITEFAAVRRGSIGQIEQGMEKLERACGRLFPAPKHPRLRETIEIALVAAVVAWGGIRTFFLQPFKIPTGSMQPTLYGVHTEPLLPGRQAPLLPMRIVERVFLGREYVDIVCKEPGRLIDARATRSGFAIFASTGTALTIGSREYHVPIEWDKLQRDFNLEEGRQYKAGEPIVQCMLYSGDHIFVDKVSYNFRLPRRGDVFVFETKGLQGTRGEFYIKRLAGVGGDELRIASPDLFVNGQRAVEPGFLRVMSRQNGYNGYSNPERSFAFNYLTHSNDVFAVPAKSYFALGDNSYHSSDSRSWGAVPHGNLVGRSWLVYWPFGRRWGFTD